MKIESYGSSYPAAGKTAVRSAAETEPVPVQNAPELAPDTGREESSSPKTGVNAVVRRSNLSITQFQEYLLANRGPDRAPDPEKARAPRRINGVPTDLEKLADNLLENLPRLMEDMRKTPDPAGSAENNGAAVKESAAAKVIVTEQNAAAIASGRGKNSAERIPDIAL